MKNKWYYLAGLYCPFCGHKGFYKEDSYGGDYYMGETCVCHECRAVFKEICFVEDDSWEEEMNQKLHDYTMGR